MPKTSLANLALKIDRHHLQCERSQTQAVSSARKVGEYLVEVKARAGHGKWLAWLAQNCAFSVRTAQGYIEIAKHWHLVKDTDMTSIKLCLAHIRKTKVITRTVGVSDIVQDPKLFMRVGVDQGVVDSYSELLKESPADKWPFKDNVTVFKVDGQLILADGAYRLLACKSANRTSVQVDVKIGTWQEAFEYALSCNASHGKRLTNADKRNIVLKALENDVLKGLSTRELAKKCGVSHMTVSRMKTDLAETSGVTKVSKIKIERAQGEVSSPETEPEELRAGSVTDPKEVKKNPTPDAHHRKVIEKKNAIKNLSPEIVILESVQVWASTSSRCASKINSVKASPKVKHACNRVVRAVEDLERIATEQACVEVAV